MKPKLKIFIEQVRSGKLKNNKAYILKYIMDNPDCDLNDLRNYLTLKDSTITSCISFLLDDGLIYTSEVSKDGKHSKFRYQKNPISQETNRKSRRRLKYEALKKRLLTEFPDLLDIQFKIPI